MAVGLLKFTEPWSETHSYDMEEYSTNNVYNTGISAKKYHSLNQFYVTQTHVTLKIFVWVNRFFIFFHYPDSLPEEAANVSKKHPLFCKF
jgi:hypothetical protein